MTMFVVFSQCFVYMSFECFLPVGVSPDAGPTQGYDEFNSEDIGGIRTHFRCNPSKDGSGEHR